MTTVTDTKRIYSTIYDKCDPVKLNCLMKSETIQGEEGKKIKLEEISLSGSVAAEGATGTATVTAQAGSGEEKILATFQSSTLDYKEKRQAIDFTAEAGQDVIIRWYLRTSDQTIRVRIKFCSYSYSMSSPEGPEDPDEPKIKAYLLIPCASETDANNIKDTIKNKISITEIYVLKE
jgi:hypothetical protein